jgi:hypothetical protein
MAMAPGLEKRWQARQVSWSSSSALQLMYVLDDALDKVKQAVSEANDCGDARKALSAVLDADNASKRVSTLCNLLPEHFAKHAGSWRRRLSGEIV